MRLPLLILVAIAFGLLGPRWTTPQDRAGGAPFTYEPPTGFARAEENAGNTDGATVWVQSQTEGEGFPARVVLTHSKRQGTVEERDLTELAQGMPALFAASGVTWTLRRHERRQRADGARVGLLEADCTRTIEGAGTIHYRTLQLVFPDDAGTSIVTATFPSQRAAVWGPIFDQSIENAHGVAVRLPPVDAGVRVAWGLAGFVLGWFALQLARRIPRTGAEALAQKSAYT